MQKSVLIILMLFVIKAATAQPSIHHYAIGKGEPMLLINGGPGWSSYHMKPVAVKLSEMGYRVILFDQRGTGKSPVKINTSTIKFDLMVDDIEQIRKERGIDSWTVYGHSFGGILAMAYASKYPEHIDKLILSAPGGVDLSFLDYYQTNLNYTLSDQEKEGIRKWSDPDKINENPKRANYNIIKNTISAFLFHKQLADSVMAKIDANTANMQVSNLVFQNLIATQYDLKPVLHKIKAPTLIIQGRQDALGQENPIVISNLIPRAKLIFVEKSAHLMWMDQPKTYFQSIKEFLNSSNTYTPVSTIEANRILSEMEGPKKINSRIQGKDGYIKVTGKARFKAKYGGMEETATLLLKGKKLLHGHILSIPRSINVLNSCRLIMRPEA